MTIDNTNKGSVGSYIFFPKPAAKRARLNKPSYRSEALNAISFQNFIKVLPVDLCLTRFAISEKL